MKSLSNSSIVVALKAFGKAFKQQWNANQYDRAVKVVIKNGKRVTDK